MNCMCRLAKHILFLSHSPYKVGSWSPFSFKIHVLSRGWWGSFWAFQRLSKTHCEFSSYFPYHFAYQCPDAVTIETADMRKIQLLISTCIFVQKLWSQLKTLHHVFVSDCSAGFTWTSILAGNGSKDMLWSVRSMCKLNQIYSVHGASLGVVSVWIVNGEALHGHTVIPRWGLYRKHKEKNLKSISELSTVLGKE